MVSFSKCVAVAATVFLATLTDAHMKLKTPVPYGQSTLDNSPLLADGSDFPCKQRTGVYDAEGAENVMAIGDPQTLSFIGSAVHGGGSCQVSLTTDLQPTKDSKWMVIKSIEGGCPASVSGNLPADPNGTGASTFQYTIPEGISPGQYTIAWSWINKVGNREFYMNCAPATVTAAKKKRYAPSPKISKRDTSFPDMFVANLASVNDCTTPESFDYVYPNPGDVVQSAGTGPYTTLSCGAAAGTVAAEQPTASASAAAGSGSTDAATAATSDATEATGAASTDAAEPTFAAGTSEAQATSSSGPGVFASGAASVATSTEASEVVPVSTAAATAAATGSTVSNGTGSTTTTTGTQSGACSDEGAWACAADGSSFQRCASGSWSVPMAMDSGMKCQPGVSANIAMYPGKVKRHSHGHLRRKAGLITGSRH